MKKGILKTVPIYTPLKSSQEPNSLKLRRTVRRHQTIFRFVRNSYLFLSPLLFALPILACGILSKAIPRHWSVCPPPHGTEKAVTVTFSQFCPRRSKDVMMITVQSPLDALLKIECAEFRKKNFLSFFLANFWD